MSLNINKGAGEGERPDRTLTRGSFSGRRLYLVMVRRGTVFVGGI